MLNKNGNERLMRTEALRNLVDLQQPIDDVTAALAVFGWDCDEELVTLTRGDVARILRRCLEADLDGINVRKWAEALEGRDDLALEPGQENVLKGLLFEISTPEITQALTSELAVEWIARLGHE